MVPQQKHIKVFIAYNHRDAKHLDRLLVHLATLEQQGAIDCWSDKKITPGTNWREEVKQAIAEAKIAVLLISADFLASSFITEDQLPPLLTAAEGEGMLILPVILSPCGFEYTRLVQFQAVNNASKPLSRLNNNQKEEVWVKVAETIRSKIVSAKWEKAHLTSEVSSREITSNSQMPTLPLLQENSFNGPEASRKDFTRSGGHQLMGEFSHQNNFSSPFSPQAMQNEINHVGKCIDTYQIEGEIGRGGLGRVYLAHDIRFERVVAIKVFYSHLTMAQKEGLFFFVKTS
jgi:hypothetical protein